MQYNYILAIIDGLSKFVWMYLAKSSGVEEVVNRLKKWASIFENSRRIITDRGVAFTYMRLRPKYLGPYKIVANIQHGRYEVEKGGNHEGSTRLRL